MRNSESHILFAKPESLENQFIEASIARRDFLRQQEDERKQREFRLLTSGLVVVSILLVPAGFGLWQMEQQRKQAIDALLTSSQKLFASGKEIDARKVGINAAKQIKQAAFWVNLDSQRTRAISTLLQQAVYGVKEYNRLEKHTNPVISVSVSQDGKTLASASADGIIKLWDIFTGEEKTTDMGHNDPVSSVAFSPDGKTLASASWDKTIKLWDVATGKEKTTLMGHSDAVISVAFSPDGKTLASASSDNTVILWDFNSILSNLDFDNLVKRDCDIMRGHLRTNRHVSGSDKTLCNNIGTQN